MVWLLKGSHNTALNYYYFAVRRWISNNFLRTKQPFAVDEKVEWAYAFDVHCNAFFPLLLVRDLSRVPCVCTG